MSLLQRVLLVVGLLSTVALAAVIFLAYRQPGLLLEFLNIGYCA
jgi:hypothetical protein